VDSSFNGGDVLGSGLGRLVLAVCVLTAVVPLAPVGLATIGFGALLSAAGGLDAPAAVVSAGQLSPPTTLPTAVAQPAAPLPVFDNDPRVAQLVASALSWLSPPVPYQWGGCSRHGVDCSCFVMLNLATVGVRAPRVTTDQLRWTLPLARGDLRPGALVYFDNTCSGCGANPTHVGLYLGNGQMIDAGDPVKVESIDTPYWRAHFDSAGWPPGL
jgi:cell wall-associated NlpC family hydrolase